MRLLRKLIHRIKILSFDALYILAIALSIAIPLAIVSALFAAPLYAICLLTPIGLSYFQILLALFLMLCTATFSGKKKR